MELTELLKLNKPPQGDGNWHIPTNANWDKVDEKLFAASRNIWEIDGITYITYNAQYVTDHWERIDDTKGAYRVEINNTGVIECYCDAGSGTITWYRNIFGDGSDGELIVSSDITLSGIKQYSNFVLESGKTITLNDNLIIFSQTQIKISGTINGNGKGAGTNYSGNSIDGGSGGRGGHSSSTPQYGGRKTNLLPIPLTMKINNILNNISDLYTLNSILKTIYSSGGGNGGPDAYYMNAEFTWGSVYGHGGEGGALIILCAPSIIIDGNIYSKGVNGTNGGVTYGPEYVTSSYGGGGGGGGSGGLIMLFYETLTETGNLDVSGGSGGSGGTGIYGTAYPGSPGSTGLIIKTQY